MTHRQETHRSRDSARRDHQGLGAGELDPPRPPEHAAPVVAAAAGGRRRRRRSSLRSWTALMTNHQAISNQLVAIINLAGRWFPACPKRNSAQ